MMIAVPIVQAGVLAAILAANPAGSEPATLPAPARVSPLAPPPARETPATRPSMLGARRGLTLSQASWTYEPEPEPKQFRLNDQVTVVVNERSVVTSEGQMDRRKKANGQATLEDWIMIQDFSLLRAPQAGGDPRVSGSMENKYRAQSDLETRDSMTFKIACRIADIRPNGTLVLEGIKSVHNNAESWEQCLTGVVRAEDVLPNNTVLSENVAELRIFKRESGHVRDGYRRGWLLQFLDRYQPF